MIDGPVLARLDDPELDRALRARRRAWWRKAVFVALLVVAVPYVAIKWIGPIVGLHFVMRANDRMTGPRLPRAPEFASTIAFGRPYKRTRLVTTSPDDAGRALHRMLKWNWSGTGVLQPWTPDSTNPLIPPVPDSNPTHLAPGQWPRLLLPLAAHGLTPDQRAFLVTVAAAGGDTLFTALARAEHANVLGTRYTFAPALDQPGGSMILPIPYPSPLFRAGAARYARAALAVGSREYDRADDALEEITSAGLVLWDSDVEQTQAIAGARLIRESLRARASLDSIRGDTASAARITRFLDGLKQIPVDTFLGTATVGEEDERLLTLLGRTDLPVSFKWTLVRHIDVRRAVRFCVGMADSAEWHAWADPARAALVHTPSDSLFFDWVAHPPGRAECKEALARKNDS